MADRSETRPVSPLYSHPAKTRESMTYTPSSSSEGDRASIGATEGSTTKWFAPVSMMNGYVPPDSPTMTVGSVPTLSSTWCHPGGITTGLKMMRSHR